LENIRQQADAKHKLIVEEKRQKAKNEVLHAKTVRLLQKWDEIEKMEALMTSLQSQQMLANHLRAFHLKQATEFARIDDANGALARAQVEFMTEDLKKGIEMNHAIAEYLHDKQITAKALKAHFENEQAQMVHDTWKESSENLLKITGLVEKIKDDLHAEMRGMCSILTSSSYTSLEIELALKTDFAKNDIERVRQVHDRLNKLGEKSEEYDQQLTEALAVVSDHILIFLQLAQQ
jgi:hypothetical protein